MKKFFIICVSICALPVVGWIGYYIHSSMFKSTNIGMYNVIFDPMKEIGHIFAKLLGDIFFMIPKTSSLVSVAPQAITDSWFCGDKTAKMISTAVFVDLYIALSVLLFYFGWRIWKKTGRRNTGNEHSSWYLFGSILPFIASVLFCVALYAKNTGFSFKDKTNQTANNYISLGAFVICGILILIFLIKNVRIQGAVKGILFTGGITLFCFVVQYAVEILICSAIIIAVIAVFVALIIKIGISLFSGDGSSSYSDSSSDYNEDDNETYTEKFNFFDFLFDSYSDSSDDSLNLLSNNNEDDNETNDSDPDFDWYDDRRGGGLVHDKYGREFKVGRSGDYVEDSHGKWHRVDRIYGGHIRLSDDKDEWLE